MKDAPLIWLAAGGTGGHLFPAEALGVVLMQRGYRARLVTDARAAQYGGLFSEAMVDIVPSETIRGGNPVLLARTAVMLGSGAFKAWTMLSTLNPAAVIGFGGYPTLPPLAAAQFRRIPTVVHDSNAVIGRANRLLARRATAIATSFPDVFAKEPHFAAKATMTGTPLRPGILAAASVPYAPPDTAGSFRLLVFGGSQGARIMADIVPPAIEKLEPALWDRLVITQQVREEDMERVRAVYAAHGIKAELAPFFRDLPARLAASHLVISRSGAGTTAELSGIGRPSILVPLPGAIDQDQFANAGALADAGGAIRLPQTEFTPDRLASEISALAAEPARLAALAAGAREVGRLDAAERLADLVTKVAGI